MLSPDKTIKSILISWIKWHHTCNYSVRKLDWPIYNKNASSCHQWYILQKTNQLYWVVSPQFSSCNNVSALIMMDSYLKSRPNVACCHKELDFHCVSVIRSNITCPGFSPQTDSSETGWMRSISQGQGHSMGWFRLRGSSHCPKASSFEIHTK